MLMKILIGALLASIGLTVLLWAWVKLLFATDEQRRKVAEVIANIVMYSVAAIIAVGCVALALCILYVVAICMYYILIGIFLILMAMGAIASGSIQKENEHQLRDHKSYVRRY